MLIACVKTGKKYGANYVKRLQAGVYRNLSGNHKRHCFVCYTDDPVEGVTCHHLPAALPGWWAKLGLFMTGEPMLYFDLDVVITGDLTRALEWPDFGILKDPWLPGYNSSIMRLTGSERHVWEQFHPSVMNMMRGDQDWINIAMPGAATFPNDWFPSFKADQITDEPPPGAMAVNLHGFPKPHQMTSGWVPRVWCE